MSVCFDSQINRYHVHAHRDGSKRFKHGKSCKMKAFDLQDHDAAVRVNQIPTWQCSRCTYLNVDRKAHCSACGTSYELSRSTPTSVYSPVSPVRKSYGHEIIVADFCKHLSKLDTHHSIPVWICNECTYCNVEQQAQCQVCANPYAQYKQYHELLASTASELPVAAEDDLMMCAEQQHLILESVEQHKTIKPTRKKFSIRKLRLVGECEGCQAMPENILTAAPHILADGLGYRRAPQQPRRRKITLQKLKQYRNDASCQSVPTHIIHSEILRKRRKFSRDELLSFRGNPDCKRFPDNLFDNTPEILVRGATVSVSLPSEDDTDMNRAGSNRSSGGKAA